MQNAEKKYRVLCAYGTGTRTTGHHISTFVAKKPVAGCVGGLILLVMFKINTLLNPSCSNVWIFKKAQMRGSVIFVVSFLSMNRSVDPNKCMYHVSNICIEKAIT